jgi:hypothetical protein
MLDGWKRLVKSSDIGATLWSRRVVVVVGMGVENLFVSRRRGIIVGCRGGGLSRLDFIARDEADDLRCLVGR